MRINEDFDGKIVLVTSIGSVAGKHVIEKLRELGCIVVGTDIYQYSWVANASEVNFFYQVERTIYKDKYQQQIGKLCSKHKVNYVVPLTDVDVDFFNENREYFKNIGVNLCIQGKDTLGIVRDKKRTEEFLDNWNSCIKAIPTRDIGEKIDTSWGWPIVCKHRNGRSSQGQRIIDEPDELDLFVKKNRSTNYVLEPFISGEVCVADLVCQKKMDQYVVVLRKELLRTGHGCGTTVEIFRDEKIENECKKLAKKFGINGCVNFEFIKDEENRYWLLECNPRFSAGVVFSSIAGYDCVSNHMRCFIDQAIDLDSHVKTQIITRRYEEYCLF